MYKEFGFGCNFEIKRKTKTETKTEKQKVISLCLWKGNIDYIFNLSNTLLWWGRKSDKIFPGWIIRIYIDKNVTSPLEKNNREQDIEWERIFSQLIDNYKNIELWFYSCPWGQDKTYKHKNTFGSLVRFHAFQDPNVEVAICKNIELLSSKKDAEIINKWVESGKKYFTTYNIQTGYDCDYSNPKLCERFDLENINMILATFGIRGNDINIFNEIIKHDINYYHLSGKNKGEKDFPYGIDEIVLTKIYKPIMNIQNTFIAPRQLIYQSIPESFDNIFQYIHTLLYNSLYDGFNIKLELSNNQIERFSLYEDMLSNLYYKSKMITVIVNQLSQFHPDIAILLSNHLREKYKINEENQSEKTFNDTLKVLSDNFHFDLFKNNKLHGDIDEPIFFTEIKAYMDSDKIIKNNIRRKELFFYFILTNYISDDEDWIGSGLKNKNQFLPKPPDYNNIRKKVRNKVITEIRNKITKGKDSAFKNLVINSLKPISNINANDQYIKETNDFEKLIQDQIEIKKEYISQRVEYEINKEKKCYDKLVLILTNKLKYIYLN